MKIALYQMNIIWENKVSNYIQLENNLKKIGDQGVDLLLLPEMSFTGFSMNTDVTKESDYETVKRMMATAKNYKTAIGFGWVKDCGEKSENHYTIIGGDGDILSDYVKIHPFSYSGENEKFQGGKEIVCFRFNNISISTFICYDLRFPEVFQIASKNVDVLFIPANWPEVRKEHWKCLLQARAIENQVYIFAVNCVGKIGGLNYAGNSCIVDPHGNILSELSGREGILEYDLNNNVQKVRSEFPVKEDRKEDLYYELYQKNFFRN